MPEHPNVRRFLDLSTAHMKPRTRAEWGLAAPGHVHPTEYGFFVWAGDHEDDETDEGWPPEVTACRRFARSLGCDYLLFDGDADTVEGLEVFDDE
ncbi:hypothetical protein [Ancylobacter polymorphus]|uniref:DUF5983 domain-containing protein n=1 Tax=Ancylobacter polymorphus TaxID=223390 RepID=A0ABU0B6D8_9HYPH|nr:hypothetical protein [Ancylobacter polymorphus]MDQ0301386.1 hypothetical protein [Ancylobacter polymorphus]